MYRFLRFRCSSFLLTVSYSTGSAKHFDTDTIKQPQQSEQLLR